MTCSCTHQSHEYAQKVHELLGSVGLKEVVEQGREAIDEAGRALEQLNRSDRAKALGFAAAIADIHLDAAKRSNRRAQEQVTAVIARIDHRTREKDWNEHVERVRVGFKEHGGAAKLADLRADIRLRLLNDDTGVSAIVAELSLAALDGAIKAGSEGDLNQVVGHLRGIMENSLRGFESAEMGRQPVGPGFADRVQNKSAQPPIGGGQDVHGWCVALYACMAWALSSLIASLIVCFAVPFCWCCFHLAALATYMAHNLLCVAVFAGRCSAQGG